MTSEQFRQELLMNGNGAVPQSRQLLLIVVDQDNLMAEISETGSRH
jgi:hypothetical protein